MTIKNQECKLIGFKGDFDALANDHESGHVRISIKDSSEAIKAGFKSILVSKHVARDRLQAHKHSEFYYS